MTEAAIWAIAGLALGAAELLAPGVFLLWIGLAAIGTGALVALFDLSWHAQLGGFIALALALVGLAALRPRRHPADTINGPTAGLVGLPCRALAFEGRDGRVSLRDGAWPARVAFGAASPAPGDVLRVTGLDGTTLLVANAEPAQMP